MGPCTLHFKRGHSYYMVFVDNIRDSFGFIWCLLMVKFFPNNKSLLLWSTLSSIFPFMLTLLVSMFPMHTNVTLQTRVLFHSSPVSMLKLRMVSISISIITFLRQLVLFSLRCWSRPHFWIEVVSMVILLINWRPLFALQGSTPNQRIFGSPPSCSHLHYFGYVCYMCFFHLARGPNWLPSQFNVCFLSIAWNVRAMAAMTLLLIAWGFLGRSLSINPSSTIIILPPIHLA